jgi:hypothetical protein
MSRRGGQSTLRDFVKGSGAHPWLIVKRKRDEIERGM